MPVRVKCRQRNAAGQTSGKETYRCLFAELYEVSSEEPDYGQVH